MIEDRIYGGAGHPSAVKGRDWVNKSLLANFARASVAECGSPVFALRTIFSRACEPERSPLSVILSGVFAAKDLARQFQSTQRRGVCGGCQRA